MANISIRGLDEKILVKLKRQASREGSSLNSLVVSLLQGESNAKTVAPPPKIFDDLDAQAGTWTRQQATDFVHDTAAFAEVDPALWK